MEITIGKNNKVHPDQETGQRAESSVGSTRRTPSREPEDLPSRLAHRSTQGFLLSREVMTRTSFRRNSVLPVMDDEEGGPRRRRVSRHYTQVDLDLMMKAEKKGIKLDFDEEDDFSRVDRLKQVELIRQMPISMTLKRQLRQRLHDAMPELDNAACDAFCYKQRVMCYQRKIKWKHTLREINGMFTLWNRAFKSVEGYFGYGVLTYFIFLKWLFQVNFFVSMVLILFVVIPQAAFPSQNYSDAMLNSNDSDLNLTYYCSAQYTVITETDALTRIIDFLQGTGWMEKTVMFYGQYKDKDVQVSGTDYNYNLPLAYLVSVSCVMLFSLIMMVRQTAVVIRDRQFLTEQYLRQYCNKVFAAWDCNICTEHAGGVRKRTIARNLVSCIAEERLVARRMAMSRSYKCQIWSMRFLANMIVIALLAGSGYLIYYTTVKTSELVEGDDYPGWHQLVQFAVQYITSVTITLLNVIIPFIFEKVVQMEYYRPGFEVNLTLIRTVFLKLASLAVLVITLYSSVTCTPKDVCGVGEEDCVAYRCWETYVGQQLYKLVITQFLAVFGLTFFIEFPRKFLVDNVDWKIIQMVGQQEFNIPKNLLDIINLQAILWLGVLFSPLLPAMIVIVSFAVFYMKMLTTMINYKASSKTYQVSDTQAFFLMVLVISYLLCGIPVFYIVWYVSPSKGCGPFRVVEHMWRVVPDAVDTWPSWIDDSLNFVASAAIIIPMITILILVIYYFKKMIAGYKNMIRLLREQLVLEGRDKQFLINRIQQQQNDDSENPTKKRLYSANQNTLPIPPAATPPNTVITLTAPDESSGLQYDV